MENKNKIILIFFVIVILIQIIKKSFKMDSLNNYPYFISFHFINNIFIKDNDDLLLNLEKTKIENILILIEIIPFLKNNLFINLQKNKILYPFFNKIFNRKNNDDYNIIVNKTDIFYLIQNFKELLDYKWELFPKLKIINSVRYIINNFYNELCLEVFDKALNMNLDFYIHNKKNTLSSKEINRLMSKLSNIYFFISNI